MYEFGDARLPDRFWDKIRVNCDTGCWEWRAQISRHGYGVSSQEGRPRPAHRVAYESLVGVVPKDMQLDHLCRVRFCVNPSHLEAVTCRENLLRGDTLAAQNAAKTQCPEGHSYSGDNVRVKRGSRVCRECERAKSRKDSPQPRGKHWADKTHCPKGHEYSPENTYVYRGSRFCRECGRAAKRAHARKVRRDPKARDRHNEIQRQRRRASK